MADESLTIQGINWRQAFPFTNLFRAFRVAIHPSKIVLALVALMLLYVGGQLLDSLWVVQDRAVPGEVRNYEQFARFGHPGQKFADMRRSLRGDIEFGYAKELQKYKIVTDSNAAYSAAVSGDHLGELKDAIKLERATTIESATKTRIQALEKANKLQPGGAREKALADIESAYNSAVGEAYTSASSQYAAAKGIRNQGLFDAFFDYEANQVSNVVHAVEEWNWFGQEPPPVASLSDLTDPAALEIPAAARSPYIPAIPASLMADRGLGNTEGPGVIQSVIRFFAVGPIWLLTQHTLYFVLFGMLFLVVWSIFGGAITRIAAVHIARDEKMSIRSALVFSVSKLLSFLCAPLIPLGGILGIGLLVTIGSLLGDVPWLGPIIIGAVFFLALVAGFIMAVLLFGLVGGFNLMYPTVAVEGSDSFDAISRSFSYLYARPWRLAFYTVVSIVYGAATYLFVRLFIYTMLMLTHHFVGYGLFISGESGTPLWPSLWPSPSTAARLSYDIDFLGLNFTQIVGAALVWFWVHLVIAILGAFAVCFYFSANTIIYYLMRREVDATDMDEVYLDQGDDLLSDTAALAEAAAPIQPAINPSV